MLLLVPVGQRRHAVLLFALFLAHSFAARRENFAHPSPASVDVITQEEVVAFLRQVEAAGLRARASRLSSFLWLFMKDPLSEHCGDRTKTTPSV